MHKRQTTPENAGADTSAIRQEFCKMLAVGIREGAYGYQTRFIRKNESFVEVWFYFYQDHHWHKRDDFEVSNAAIPELFRQLEMVASRDVADDWKCRRIDHSDRTDFELKLQPEPFQAHINSDLESFLMGCFFSGHHDTGQDARRRIRFSGH